MEQTLAGFLSAYEARTWDAATVNCLMFPAAWAIWLGHRDPVERWRGAFSSEAEFRAIVSVAGGCVALVDEAAMRIAARPVCSPICGDIGVIGSPTDPQRQFGAIFDGERWLVRFIHSIGPMRARALTIWRL